MRFSGKDYVFYSLLLVPEGFIFFSLFLYSGLPNLPSFQICWVLTLIGSSLVTRKQDPRESHQIIFSEYVCARCLYSFHWKQTSPSTLPPNALQEKRDHKTRWACLVLHCSPDQRPMQPLSPGRTGDCRVGQLPAEPDSLWKELGQRLRHW